MRKVNWEVTGSQIAAPARARGADTGTDVSAGGRRASSGQGWGSEDLACGPDEVAAASASETGSAHPAKKLSNLYWVF